jgi:hypothetical protein
MLLYLFIIQIAICLRSDPKSVSKLSIDKILNSAKLSAAAGIVPTLAKSTHNHLSEGNPQTSHSASPDDAEEPQTLRNLSPANSPGPKKNQIQPKFAPLQLSIAEVASDVNEEAQNKHLDGKRKGVVDGVLALVGCVTSLTVGWATTTIHFTVKNPTVKAGGIAGIGVMYVVIMTMLTLFWFRLL